MNLQEMIQKYNDDSIVLDKNDVKLSDVLFYSKYSKLLEYLNNHGLVYCNDIKKNNATRI